VSAPLLGRGQRVELGRTTHAGAHEICQPGQVTRTPTVLVSAQRPLLRSGLERIVRDAGVQLTDSLDADFVLRAVQPLSSADLDVAYDDGVFVITCRTRPDPDVWAALLRVIDAGVS
jgi:hypothetical protein